MLPRISEGCSCGTHERMRADPHAPGTVRSCAPGRRVLDSSINALDSCGDAGQCARRCDRSLPRACGPLRSRLGIRFVRGPECAACRDRSLPRACARSARGSECVLFAARNARLAVTARSRGPAARSARGSEGASPGAWRKPGNRRAACRAENGGRNPLGMAAEAQAARRRRPEEAFFAARFRGAARRAGRSFFRLMVPRQPGAPQRHLTCSTSGSKR